MDHSRPAASGVAIDRDVIRVLVSTSEGIAASVDALLANDQAIAASLVAGENRAAALAWESALGCASGAREGALPEPATEARWSGMAVALLTDAAAANRQVAAIARAASAGLGPELTPRERGLVQRLAELAGTAWQLLPDAYAERGRAAGDPDVERAISDGLEAAWVRVRRQLGREPDADAGADGFCQVARAYSALVELGLGATSRLRALGAALDGNPQAPAVPVAITWLPPGHPMPVTGQTGAPDLVRPTDGAEPVQAVAEVVTWEASEAPRRAG